VYQLYYQLHPPPCVAELDSGVILADGGESEEESKEEEDPEEIELDEDIATLDTPMLWSFPSCNLSPTQLPRHPRIQQTRHHCFGHNSFIRHQNGAFLDALERGQ
jgi:hypothetical protein